MKYVITGGAGHISKPLTEKLLAAGHTVTIIGRNAENLKELVAKGAKAAIGSVEDVKFLTETFKGADAVYTMVPPNFAPPDWKTWIGQIGTNYANAIKDAGVKYVVNLSSVGAHVPGGAGPVSGLYRVEQALNKLQGVAIKHLRPGYFFLNFLASIALVKNAGIIGSNFGDENSKMVLVHPDDIADIAFEELSNLNFTGTSVRYIAGDERSTPEIAEAIGKAIGKSGLPWITFSDSDSLNGMVQAGLPQEIAKNYVEMGNAIKQGVLFEDYWKHHPENLGKVKLVDFAQTFASVYNTNSN
jgi:uncharacterized protein YbjT (DUF2867 family)